jgi:hypothetical protein
MKAVHLICKRDDGVNLNHVSQVHDGYKSGYWKIPLVIARLLVDGWIYLHPKKGELSGFGGKISRVEPVEWEGKPRVAFIFDVRREARGTRWRGIDAGMAVTGGVIDATYDHEIGS